jgi:hypothetical protein
MEDGFKILASQLLHKLQTISIQKLELEDEEKSMHHLLSVMVDPSEMNDFASLRHLNLAMLSSYELPGKQTIASTFYPTAVVTFTRLMTLRLGKACLDQQNGPDERGKLDVDYFIQSIPKWQRLRTLELPGLGLTAENAGDILEASSKCPSLRNVDLSDNFLQDLEAVVRRKDVKCRLDRLNLSANSFGAFDDYESTCDALGALLSQYTCLIELDLSANCLGIMHGPAIASVLGTCTHLSVLNLSDNEWDATVGHSIRTAWVGQEPDFLLRR